MLIFDFEFSLHFYFILDVNRVIRLPKALYDKKQLAGWLLAFGSTDKQREKVII